MIQCQFITTEDDETDLIVSLCSAKEISADQGDVYLHWDVYNALLCPEERGVSFMVGYSEEKRCLLKKVTVRGRVVEVIGSLARAQRDCRRVEESDWLEMLAVLRKMRRNASFELQIEGAA